MVLKSAIELDIIEIIFTATSEGGCACISVISPAKIAARIPSKNPDASVLLDRMLRLLASYSEGPTCKFLVKLKVEVVDLSPLCFSLHHYEVSMKSWYLLNDAILGRGMTAYEYPETDQMFSRVFNLATSNHTTLIMKKIRDIYEGSWLQTVS